VYTRLADSVGRSGFTRREQLAAGLGRRRRFVGWVLAVGALDFGLEQFAVIPILPAVQQAEDSSLTATTWLLTGFSLAAIASAPLLGRLGDMYGKRRLLLVSVTAFGVGSLVCALAGSLEWLIGGRVIQGMGAALGPLAIGLARDHAPRQRAPVWIGLLVAMAGAGAALGLVLGGVLVDHVSVAAVFWFLFGLATVLFLAISLFVPETPLRDAVRPDWAGGVLLSGTLLAALLAISEGNNWGWSSLRVVALGVASAVLLASFVTVERSTSTPLIEMRLLARRAAWSANLVAFAMGFSLFIAGVIVPQISTLPAVSGYGLGLTFTQTGLVLLPGAIAIVVGGWASGALVRRTGVRALVGCGAVLAGAAYAGLALDHGSVAPVVAANIALGLGIGLAFAATTNLVVHSVDERRTSVFAATTAVSRFTGAALGAQIAAAIVIAAGVASDGFPAESGFTDAFVLGLVAAVGALMASVAIPRRTLDPLLPDGTVDTPRAMHDSAGEHRC
jgi:MFS family permease